MKKLTEHLPIIIFVAMLVFSMAWLAPIKPVSAQGMPIIIGTQTAVSGCSWPTAYVAVSNGLAICPLSLPTGPALAIAVNGGPFTQIPMAITTTGVTSFNGRTGAVTLTDDDVTGTGLKVATTVTGTFTATSTPQ